MISKLHQRQLWSASAITLVMGLPTLAVAQTAVPSDPPSQSVPVDTQATPPTSADSAAAANGVNPANQLAEIVITANKRAENLQSASIAATVVTGDDLVSRGVTDVTGLQKIAPSVKLTSIRQQAQVYMRGIGSALTASNADPAVAINSNGVYLPSEMTGAAFFDMERVEVLPGPQGTLYGRNAAGGAINVLTRRPGDHFGGEAFIEAGNYNAINTFAAVDVPVTEDLAIRVAGFSQRHDPYIEGLNGSGIAKGDNTGGRVSLRFTPTDRTRIFATATETRARGIASGNQNNPPAGGDYWKLPVDANALGLRDNFKTQIFTAQLDQELTDNITFTYVAGHSSLTGGQNIMLFNTGPAYVHADQDIRSTTNEMRLSGDFKEWKWLTGIYLYNAKAYNASYAYLPSPIVETGPFTQYSKGYAGFGQLTYSIADNLRITGGLRYSWDKKSLAGTNSNVLPNGTVLSTVIYANNGSKDRVDYKLGLEYDVAKDSLLYASIQSGYNQGGFSTAVASVGSQVAVPYLPATLTAYTVGSKNRFFDRKVQLNLEAFYYNYKNYQVSSRNLLTGQNQIYNAQKAETYGVQADSSFVITSQDHLDFSVGLLHAEATKLLIPPTADFSGFTLPFSPTVTVVTSYSHRWNLSSGSIEGQVSARHVNDVWTTYNHAAGTFQPSNTKYDASLAYKPNSDRWAVTLYGQNLSNKATFGALSGGALPGPAAGLLEAPRTYGVRLSANF